MLNPYRCRHRAAHMSGETPDATVWDPSWAETRETNINKVVKTGVRYCVPAGGYFIVCNPEDAERLKYLAQTRCELVPSFWRTYPSDDQMKVFKVARRIFLFQVDGLAGGESTHNLYLIKRHFTDVWPGPAELPVAEGKVDLHVERYRNRLRECKSECKSVWDRAKQVSAPLEESSGATLTPGGSSVHVSVDGFELWDLAGTATPEAAHALKREGEALRR